MIQQVIIDAARDRGLTIGHDGCTIPTHVEEIEVAVCSCEGTGQVPVHFGGMVIAKVPCPGCKPNG
jgi:hypothetical protein